MKKEEEGLLKVKLEVCQQEPLQSSACFFVVH